MTQPIDALKIAREAGFLVVGNRATTWGRSEDCAAELNMLAARILERAAIECEQSEAFRGSVFAQRIRALKPVLEKDNT
jgi:hypothetical protein